MTFPTKIWVYIIRSAKKIVSAISVHNIGVFVWKFDRDSASSTKKCPLYSISAIDRFDCTRNQVLLYLQWIKPILNQNLRYWRS